MSRRRFSLRSAERAGGFSLAEVLVSLGIASIVVFGVATGVVFAVRAWTDHQERLQVQQSLREAVAALSREVRVAGACMFPYWTGTAPPANFRPIDGTNNGALDTITVRTNPACAESALSGAGCDFCGSFTVQDPSNFQAGNWAYLYNSGTLNQYFLIRGIAGDTITVDASTPITGNYPPNASTVFGIDQRVFAISSTCADCGGVPTLTLQVANGQPSAVARGIDSLDIHYVLNRAYNAATCDFQTGGTTNLCVVNLPGSGPSPASDWTLVRAITFAVDARSLGTVRAAGSADGLLHLSDTFEITPRNFVFNQQNGGRL
jgi:Tfp pilus assembly protein PilV